MAMPNEKLAGLDAAVYLRKSRMEEGLATEEVLSKHQKTLYDYAAAHGIHILEQYPEVVSGESLYARPQMLRLLQDVEDGLYDAALEAKKQGKIRHIAITNHRLSVAHEAIDSGLYETLQFPYSYLAGPQEQELVDKCQKVGMGFIAMKGMAGGLIRSGLAAAAWMALQPTVVPIWGVQHEWELDQFLSAVRETPAMTEEYQQIIDHDRKELAGDFCRGCGYCMPCPVGIEINQCARMSLMLRRAPEASWLSDQWQAEMKKIENCLHCNQCKSKCPYGLDTPRLLAENYQDYKTYLAR